MNASHVGIALCEGFEPVYVNSDVNINYLIVGSVCAPLSGVLMIMNSLVIYAILVTRRVKTPIDVLMLLLSLTDLACSVGVVPTYSSVMFDLSEGRINCSNANFLKWLGYNLTGMSVSTIGCISYQSYIALAKPFLYISHLNMRSCISALIGCWAVLIATTTVAVYVKPDLYSSYKLGLGSAFVLICCVMCYMNFVMNKTIKKMMLREPQNRNRTIKLKKSIRTSFAIIIAFIACYFGIAILVVLLAVTERRVWFRSYFGPWVEFAVILNNLLDPLIYCFRLKVLRRKILRCIPFPYQISKRNH